MFDYYSEIRFKIAGLISRQKNTTLDQVLASTSLSQLDLDLIDLVEVILHVEKMFHLEIPDEVAIESLEDFVDFVYRNSTLSEAS